MNALDGNADTLLKVLAIVAYWLGMVARAVLPYLKAYWESGGAISFDWDYVKGQAVAALVAFLGLISMNGGGLVAEIGAMSIAIAFLTGYFAASAGREGQKLGAAALDFRRKGPLWSRDDDNHYA